jgi:hypothetical protein
MYSKYIFPNHGRRLAQNFKGPWNRVKSSWPKYVDKKLVGSAFQRKSEFNLPKLVNLP